MTPELLAPAGNLATLHAAVRAGADAVYLGVGEFNARRNAENFTFETLAQGCDYAHLRGRKVYVTMNTIILPSEMGAAIECAKACYAAGADAFIVQDIGLAIQIQREIPEARIHASTQMNIHNASGVDACADLGVSRITLARELSIGEIAHLCEVAKGRGLEIETFAHGALCICYSGQCLMSSMIGGRSANRGLCAQACRLPYELIDMEDRDRELNLAAELGEHLLSPKDLCTLDVLEDLVSAGVSSLKIEGRMKSPEYVYAVTQVYREALDALGSGEQIDDDVNEDMHDRLESVFSRGFTTAYMEGKRDRSIMSYQRPNNRGQFAGRIKGIGEDSLELTPEIELVPGDLVEIWSKRGNAKVEVSKVSHSANGKSTIYATPSSAREMSRARVGDRVFRIRSAQAAYVDSDNDPRIGVSGNVKIRIGEPLEVSFHLTDMPDVAAFVDGPIVEAARTKPITAEDALEHIDRLGSTPFVLDDLKIELDADAGLGFSQLHHLRADALELLVERMLEGYREGRAPYAASKDAATAQSQESRRNEASAHVRSSRASQSDLTDFDVSAIRISAIATNPDCARAAKRAGATDIYVPALNYRRGQAQLCGARQPDAYQAGFPKHCTIMIPAINHDAVGLSREALLGEDVWEYAEEGAHIYVDSLASLYKSTILGCIPEVGPGLPITNKESVEAASAFGTKRIWLSPELNLRQIEDLVAQSSATRDISFGIKVAGAQELMVTEHCLLMDEGDCAQKCSSCRRREKRRALNDRKGYDFPISVDMYGRSHLYNGVMLDSVPAIPELIRAGITDFMVDTTLMNPEESAQSVGRAVSFLNEIACGSTDIPKLPNTTSGHIYRGVK